jgi:hypothetical protein
MGAAAEVRRSDARTVTAVTLKDADEPMTPAEIADAIGAPRNNGILKSNCLTRPPAVRLSRLSERQSNDLAGFVTVGMGEPLLQALVIVVTAVIGDGRKPRASVSRSGGASSEPPDPI